MAIDLADLRALIRDEDELVFTDESLDAAILAAGGDSLLRAAGVAFQSLAAEHAIAGKSIRTDDLGIDTRGRGADLLKVAQSFFKEAAAADAAGADETFVVVPLPPRPVIDIRPEATPYPIGEGWR